MHIFYEFIWNMVYYYRVTLSALFAVTDTVTETGHLASSVEVGFDEVF